MSAQSETTQPESLKLETIKLGQTVFKTPAIEVDVGNPAIFTKVARLTMLHASNKVKLTSFTLNAAGVVTAQTDLEDQVLANGASLEFRLEADLRGAFSRAYAYWHTTYPPHFVAAFGAWAQPFPLEYAGYIRNQDGSFAACRGYAGKIERRDPMITATMASTNVVAGTNSISSSVWKDNEIMHLVLWLEQNQTGSAKLGANTHKL